MDGNDPKDITCYLPLFRDRILTPPLANYSQKQTETNTRNFKITSKFRQGVF